MTTSSHPSDVDAGRRLADTLARIALGDRAAFESLYRQTSSHLFGVILRIQNDRGQAEDLLQDVYVSIWRHAQGYDAGRSHPMAWLTGIARHRAIDSLRRRRTEPATLPSVVVDADGDEIDRLARVASDDPGPLQRLERAGESLALRECLDTLSAPQQQCLALAYVQGLSHAELAQQLQQPLGSVKSWVRRGLLALKDCLGRRGDFGGA